MRLNQALTQLEKILILKKEVILAKATILVILRRQNPSHNRSLSQKTRLTQLEKTMTMMVINLSTQTDMFPQVEKDKSRHLVLQSGSFSFL